MRGRYMEQIEMEHNKDKNSRNCGNLKG